MRKKIDFYLIISMLGLCVYSLLFVYSSSVDIAGNITSSEFVRQLSFAIFGLLLFLILQFVPLSVLLRNAVWGYLFCILILVITLIFGEVRNGSKSWISIMSFSLQISEFTKVFTTLLLAVILSEQPHKEHSHSFWRLSMYAGLIVLPMILILMQPDMGTALVYVPILLGIYYMYGVAPQKIVFVIGIGVISVITLIASYYFNSVNLRSIDELVLLRSTGFISYLLVLGVICVLSVLGMITGYFKKVFTSLLYMGGMFATGSVLAYVATLVLKPYQLRRLLVFVNPDSDPLGSGWHILQSVAALGTGGLSGNGFLKGTYTKLEYLPQKSTDFIFAVIGEETGFLGSIGLFFLYAFLIWRVLIIGIKSNNLCTTVFCSGISAMFFTHFLVNVGMGLGLMPITGIPLLFISYGGSAMVSSFLSLGIVHKMYMDSEGMGALPFRN